MLREPTDEVDSIQVGNVNREMKILKKEPKLSVRDQEHYKRNEECL